MSRDLILDILFTGIVWILCGAGGVIALGLLAGGLYR